MAISTLDQLIGAAKQRAYYNKTGAVTTINALAWFSLFDVSGGLGAGTLAGSSLAAGVVPTDADAGYPPINSFGASAKGYLSRATFNNSVACRLAVFDRLWLGGAYPFNAAQALSAQPSYSGRLPNTDYKGLEIWAEAVTAFTGNQTFNVTYTNESGTGSRTTGATGIGAAPTLRRCWRLPLQAGDKGVQKIDNVAGGTGSAGTANIMVLRRLLEARIPVAGQLDIQDLLRTGLPEVFDTSALFVMIAADSTSSGIPDITLDIANG